MSNKSSSGGYSLPFVIFIVFLVLKLTSNITWSWWWVTSPLWIPFAFGFSIIGAILAIICGVIGIIIISILIALLFGQSIDSIRLKLKKFWTIIPKPKLKRKPK